MAVARRGRRGRAWPGWSSGGPGAGPGRSVPWLLGRTPQWATHDAPEGTPVSGVAPSRGPILAVEALLRLVELIDRLRFPARRAGGGARCPDRMSPPVPGLADAGGRPAGGGDRNGERMGGPDGGRGGLRRS